MVKAVIFDVWGTLVETGLKSSPNKLVKKFLREKSDFSDFIIKFEESFMTKEFESLKEGFENVVVDFGLDIPDFVYDKLIGMWNKNAILARPYEDISILKELKNGGYKVFVLSNLDKFSHEQLKQKINFEEEFDGVYLSYQTGKLKNNVESFDNLLKENDLNKEDVVMVGDSIQSDIESARQAGISSILIDRRDTREFDPKITSFEELTSVLEQF